MTEGHLETKQRTLSK